MTVGVFACGLGLWLRASRGFGWWLLGCGATGLEVFRSSWLGLHSFRWFVGLYLVLGLVSLLCLGGFRGGFPVGFCCFGRVSCGVGLVIACGFRISVGLV